MTLHMIELKSGIFKNNIEEDEKFWNMWGDPFEYINPKYQQNCRRSIFTGELEDIQDSLCGKKNLV